MADVKEKRVLMYEESYKAPGLKVRPDYLPVISHSNAECMVTDAWVLKAGRERVDDQEYEYQIMKVRFKVVT